jgi:hypothetical protein
MEEPSMIARWLAAQLGPDRRFKSARQLSIASGLSPNVVANILERGKADAGTLVKIAHTLDTSPVTIFIIMGWLTEQDLAEAVNEAEIHAMGIYLRLPDEYRRAWLESGERLLELAGGPARARRHLN